MVTWHNKNLELSHVDPTINSNFLAWLKTKYANDDIGDKKAISGKHNKLAITSCHNT
jgi:hypothetical protein